MLSHNVMLQVPPPCTKVPAAIKRVHFSTDENDSQLAPHKELTSEMVQDMWYTSTEMDCLKEDVKSIILQRNRELAQVTKEVSENALGLERYETKRDEFRRAAIFYTLQAQKKSKDPTFIGLIAHQCTDFARAAATLQGMKDFGAAYDATALDSSLDTQRKITQRDEEEECTEPPSAKKQRTASVA